MYDSKINTIFGYSKKDIKDYKNEYLLLEAELNKFESFKGLGKPIKSYTVYYYKQILEMLNSNEYVLYVENEINFCRNISINLKKLTKIKSEVE